MAWCSLNILIEHNNRGAFRCTTMKSGAQHIKSLSHQMLILWVAQLTDNLIKIQSDFGFYFTLRGKAFKGCYPLPTVASCASIWGEDRSGAAVKVNSSH